MKSKFLLFFTFNLSVSAFSIIFGIYNLTDNEIELKSVPEVYFEVPRVELVLEAAPGGWQFPDYCSIQIVAYMDIGTLIRYANTCKNARFTVLKQCYFWITKDFLINVPQRLIITTYAAFFWDKRDYSRFSGLNNRVIDLKDFIVINFMVSLEKDIGGHCKFIGFIPGLEDQSNKVAKKFLDFNSKFCVKDCPLKLVAFRRLAESSISNCASIFELRGEILPYSLLLIRNYFFDHGLFKGMIISNLSRMPSKVVYQFILETDPLYRLSFAKEVLGRLSAYFDININEIGQFYANINQIIGRPENVHPDLQLVYNFVNSFDKFTKKQPEFYENGFNIDETNIMAILRDRSICKDHLMQLFFEILPVHLVDLKYRALKCLFCYSADVSLLDGETVNVRIETQLSDLSGKNLIQEAIQDFLKSPFNLSRFVHLHSVNARYSDGLQNTPARWTLLHLSLVYSKLDLVEAILNHPGFDKQSLLYKLQDKFDVAEFLSIISWIYYKSGQEERFQRLKARIMLLYRREYYRGSPFSPLIP